MNKNISILFFKAIVVISIVIIIDLLGVAFLALKFVSIPFVPNRNIDNMSDYYTAVWESVRGNSVDNGRFTIVDVNGHSRSEITEIIKSVNNMNPTIIGLDVSYIWEENPSEDSILVQTIQSIPNIVLPVEYQDKDEGDNAFRYNIFHNQWKDKDYGVVSFPDNRDIIRLFTPSFCVGNQSIDAFGCVIAKKCGADISQMNGNSMILNYTTLKLTDDDVRPGFQFLNLNLRDSLSLASEISDKIVLIGDTHDTRDQHLTPLGYSLSGVMIHAHVINFLMENKIIQTTSLIIRYLICFVIAVAVLLWYQKQKHSKYKNGKIWKTILLWCILFIVSVIIFAVIGTILFCNFCYFVDFSPYIVTLIIVHLLKDMIH